MALDGSTDGLVGAVGAVLHLRRQRRMAKKYSQLLEGNVKSNTSIKASDGSEVLKLELRLPPESILPDDFPVDELIHLRQRTSKVL